MEHIKVKWFHSRAECPEWIYSELDEQRWEKRKVEVFPDGSISYADGCTDHTFQTGLGEVPMPALEEIAANEEFAPEQISKAEFESLWKKAKAFEHHHSVS